MKIFLYLFPLIAVSMCGGCGDPQPPPPRYPAMPPPAPVTPKPQRLKTPEEILGIELPGKLAASVEAWAGSNELGDYYKQSRERLAGLHAQLIEDYKVRKESDLPPTDFTKETLRKYREAFSADSTLRAFMVECYSYKEVRPLPQTIARVFTTSTEERGEIRELIKKGPAEIERLKGDFTALKSEMSELGTATWIQEKDLKVWNDRQTRLADISLRANKACALASAWASNMARVVRANDGSEELKKTADDAEQLKSDWSAFAAHISKQLEIVKGQILLTQFANDCKTMADGMNAIPSAYSKMRVRRAEIAELTNRIRSSYVRNYSDLNELAQQAAEIKKRSHAATEKETALGKRVQKIAGNYERLFGTSAVNVLKWKLSDSSARARVDAELEAFKRAANISTDSDPAGIIAATESKAYQLADRMEEEAMLKTLDETLLSAQRLAARRR